MLLCGYNVLPINRTEREMKLTDKIKRNTWTDGEFDPVIEDMVGVTFDEVTQTEDTLTFKCSEGSFVFYHSQDCCECVNIESITGDLQDLVGSPILKAEEATNEATPEDHKFEYEPESYTWTFYKFATIKGYVDVRWLGESNGYYSESVSLTFKPKASL